MYQVFISYCWDDVELVAEIQRRLERSRYAKTHRIAFWRDTERASTDRENRWGNNLRDALDGSEFVLFMASNASMLDGRTALWELDEAKKRRKFVAYVLLDVLDTLPRSRLAGCRGLPFSAGAFRAPGVEAKGWFKQLLQDFETMLGPKFCVPPLHPDGAEAERRRAEWCAFRESRRRWVADRLDESPKWASYLADKLELDTHEGKVVADALLASSAPEVIAHCAQAHALAEGQEPAGAEHYALRALTTLSGLLPVCGDEEGRFYVSTRWFTADEWWFDPDVETVAFVELAFAKLHRRAAEFRPPKAGPDRDPSLPPHDDGPRGKGHLYHYSPRDRGPDLDGQGFLTDFEAALDRHFRGALPPKVDNPGLRQRAVEESLEVDAEDLRLHYYITVYEDDDPIRAKAIRQLAEQSLSPYKQIRVATLRKAPSGWIDKERGAVRRLTRLSTVAAQRSSSPESSS